MAHCNFPQKLQRNWCMSLNSLKMKTHKIFEDFKKIARKMCEDQENFERL